MACSVRLTQCQLLVWQFLQSFWHACHLSICRSQAMFHKHMLIRNSLLSTQQQMMDSTWQTSQDGIPNLHSIYNR
uniref:Putative secreted protein n=1 Tax=Panstrongylus lignarius TaxID=156445 RepID=A0A224XX91_9HEMI